MFEALQRFFGGLVDWPSLWPNLEQFLGSMVIVLYVAVCAAAYYTWEGIKYLWRRYVSGPRGRD